MNRSASASVGFCGKRNRFVPSPQTHRMSTQQLPLIQQQQQQQQKWYSQNPCSQPRLHVKSQESFQYSSSLTRCTTFASGIPISLHSKNKSFLTQQHIRNINCADSIPLFIFSQRYFHTTLFRKATDDKEKDTAAPATPSGSTDAAANAEKVTVESEKKSVDKATSETDNSATKVVEQKKNEEGNKADSLKTNKSSTTNDDAETKGDTAKDNKPPQPKAEKQHPKQKTSDNPKDQMKQSKSSPVDTNGVRKVDIAAISPSLEGGPPIVDGVKTYSTPELTRDAQFHKAGLSDPTCPTYQNPLYHNNPNYENKFFREDFASDEEFEAAVLPAPPLDHPDGTPSYPKYLHDLADDMLHLTMLEMNELINRMADHYGFHEGILSPDGVGDGGDDDDGSDGDGSGAAAAPEPEKTTFDVKLVSFDASIKIKIIKEVRAIVAGLGLKEAKELVEGAPVILQKGVGKDVADVSKEKLEALGAVIEIV